MPPRGRPPKPIEEKRRTGNPGKRPLPTTLTVVPALEREPIELEPAETLDRVFEYAQRWLGETDMIAVTMLRETLEERAELRAHVISNAYNEPARRALRALDAQIIDMLTRLGFDPTARARLGLAEVKTASKLQELRRAQREVVEAEGD